VAGRRSGTGGASQCVSQRLARAKREVKEGERRDGVVRGCCRWLFIGRGRELMHWVMAASGGGIDGQPFRP
jgi:hypothetical protein